MRKLIVSLVVAWLVLAIVIMQMSNSMISIYLLICMTIITIIAAIWIVEGGLNSIIAIISPPIGQPDHHKPKEDKPKDKPKEPTPEMYYVMRPSQLE